MTSPKASKQQEEETLKEAEVEDASSSGSSSSDSAVADKPEEQEDMLATVIAEEMANGNLVLQSEEEPEEVLAKLVGLVLGAGGSRRGEMDEESDHALGAEVPLWMIGGGLNERQACAGIMGWLIRRDTRVIARWAARSAWGT